MRRAGYLAAMCIVVPLTAIGVAIVCFILSINTGIECALEEWK